MARPNSFSYSRQVNTRFKRFLVRAVEFLSGREHLQQLYWENRRAPLPNESFWQAAIRHLRLDIDVNADHLANAPKQGPLIVIANHPYGVLDGLTLCYLVEKFRTDFKILVSSVLLQAPELQPYALPIDLSARPGSKQANVLTRQTALAHLKDGGALLIFPAGLISTSPDRLGRRTAVDPAWGTLTAKLAHRAQAPILPIFFSGQNGRLFQMVSYLSRSLRLALIFHEVKARIGSRLPVTVGEVITPDVLATFGNCTAATAELRKRTYALSDHGMTGGIAEETPWRP